MTRKWFQIHLSTAIVLMFAAGGLIWANTAYEQDTREWVYDQTRNGGRMSAIGFPFELFTRTTIQSLESDSRAVPLREFNANFKYGSLFMNSVVAIFLLIYIAIVVESLIRRREMNKP